MNNPNPFVPQGSLLEQKNRKRTRFQVAVFAIFAVNILVITPMLIQGCKRDAQTDVSNITPQSQDTGTGAAPMTPDTNTTTLPPVPAASNIVSTIPPVPPQPPVPATSTGTTEYVIAKGDTLDSIHKKFSVSVKAIEDANPGIVPTKLQLGHKIQIPAPTAPAAGAASVATDGSDTYVVKTGDSLSKIAGDHHTTVKAIEALNNLKTTKIKVGDKLKMPPAKAPAAPVVDTAPAPVPTAPAPAAPSTTIK